MRLVRATDAYLLELMAWFPDARSRLLWGGPLLRHPYDEKTFREDIRFNELPSYFMVDDENELVGFGQYYLREGRCHLARLAIAPSRRGRGLGSILVRELSVCGCNELEVDECSLFVLNENDVAIRLYLRMGFQPVAYPGGGPPLEGCTYMVVEARMLWGQEHG